MRPTSFTLPFGYNVAIVYVDDKKMRDEAECQPDDPTPDGLWDSETRTIYVLRRLRKKRLRYVLIHEVLHAAIDWQHDLLNDGAAVA